ncbi:putative ABC transport system permease protein [Eubacterium ruminantium]|uniref:Putative ABC transport system permease protein n=2 Tax=Eubacterium ruminantium TaxID=42322 RepID=A0A1T4KHI1_9FIRM|nr:putative ABC transport system permease protein [Eubacterium ruminantium]SDM27243.1 putative ABC transport system permease protein [Eubacterium ruminantium]SJZ41888.1 putative ABC transport system permease protein [Eubacterium ruminantium]
MASHRKRIIFKYIFNNVIHNYIFIVIIIILSGMLFAGRVTSESLKKALNNMEKRFGSDLMLVPKGSKEKAEGLILEGQRSSFYFENIKPDELNGEEGIEKITTQYFLKSLSADCCSSEVQIVFFNPDTDFLVGPWIKEEYKKKLDKDQVIIGSDIDYGNSNKRTIKLFGKEYDVAAKMDKTGTSLDNSVYFSFASREGVIKDAEAKGSFISDKQRSKELISTVYLNVKEGYKTDEVLSTCHKKLGEDFDVVFPKSLNESISRNIKGITGIINTVLVVAGIFLLIMLFIINKFFSEQKKREISVFLILGNSRKKMIQMMVIEAVTLTVIGTVVGCFIGALVVIPFGKYIGITLGMPYLGPSVVDILLHFAFCIFVVLILVLISWILLFISVKKMDPYLALKKEAE